MFIKHVQINISAIKARNSTTFLTRISAFQTMFTAEHAMVLKPVLVLQRMILSRFGGAGGYVTVTGIILYF